MVDCTMNDDDDDDDDDDLEGSGRVFFVSFTGATLTTPNPLWTDLRLSPVLRSERLAGDCLSRGTTLGRK